MYLEFGLFQNLISALVVIGLISVFSISLRRLQITGSARRTLLIEGALTLIIWIFVIFYWEKNELLSDFSYFHFIFLLLLMLVFAFWLAFSNLGLLLTKGLSLSELAGLQSFRILLNIALLFGAQQGLTSRILTLSGWNFDLLTGISAFVLFFYGRQFSSSYILRTWNWVGLIFLVVLLALIFKDQVSMLENSKTFYISMSGFLLEAALIFHLIIFRKLKLDPRTNNIS